MTTYPFLHRLLVVRGVERSVGTAVVNKHLGTSATVARVHGLDNLGPACRCVGDSAVSAVAVPGIDSTAGRLEATGGHTGVETGGGEHVRVGGGHDVLPTC